MRRRFTLSYYSIDSFNEINLFFAKVELRCRQHIISDLDKYYRALDWAIMQYHRYSHPLCHLYYHDLFGTNSTICIIGSA